jgi:hypothetical protein
MEEEQKEMGGIGSSFIYQSELSELSEEEVKENDD